MRRRNPEVRHWLDKLSIQDRDEKENAVSKLGEKLLEKARDRGAPTERTVTWLLDEQIDTKSGRNSYEVETLGPRIDMLVDNPPSEPCPRRWHEWNLPAAGDETLECGVCGRTDPITETMSPRTLLSKRAKRSARFQAQFAKGLREAQAKLRTVH